MFDILRDLDDGLFCVYYSGTLLDGFDSREEAEQEFYEDNIPTLNHSLTEWFQNSLR